MTTEALAREAGISPRMLAAIGSIESGGGARAVRFERRLFQARGGSIAGLPSGTGRATVDAAMARNARAAVESTSWGTYQVLGAHLLALFGPDPRTAVAAFDSSPSSASDRLLARWFQHNGQARAAANALDWDRLARLYNGAVDPDGPEGPLSSRWATRVREAYARLGGEGPTAPPTSKPRKGSAGAKSVRPKRTARAASSRSSRSSSSRSSSRGKR